MVITLVCFLHISPPFSFVRRRPRRARSAAAGSLLLHRLRPLSSAVRPDRTFFVKNAHRKCTISRRRCQVFHIIRSIARRREGRAAKQIFAYASDFRNTAYRAKAAFCLDIHIYYRKGPDFPAGQLVLFCDPLGQTRARCTFWDALSNLSLPIRGKDGYAKHI